MKILKARRLGPMPVYDLAVDHEHHSFVHQSQAILHNCAFVIANKPISSFIPMTRVSGMPVTQFTAPSVEGVGGLKMDFLNIKILAKIQGALRLIRARSPDPSAFKDIEIPGRGLVRAHYLVPVPSGGFADVWDLPEDQEVFADVAEGRVETVFQFGTPGAIQWLEHFNHAKPNGNKAIDSIEAMAAFTALDRPGGLDKFVPNPEWQGDPADPDGQHNMLVEFARRARGAKPSPGVLPILDELVPETYGVMCVAEGTPVKTDRGLVPIEEVRVGSLVQTHTGKWRSCSDVIRQGIRPCLRLRFTTGVEVLVTADHRLFTHRGWIEARDLRADDLIKQEWISDEEIADGDEADWVIGLLLADGNLCSTTPEVACSSEGFAEAVKRIADRAWGLDCVVYRHGTAWHCRMRHLKRSGTTQNPLTAWLREHGLLGLDFANKVFPARVTRAMCAGFFEGDGCVVNRRLRVKNRALASRFFECLQAMRVASSFHEDEPGVWAVSVGDALPLRVKEEGKALEAGYTVRPALDFIRKRDGEIYYNHKRSLRPFVTRRAYRMLQSRYQQLPREEPSVWGRLLSRRDAGLQRVFDLSVEVDHSFIAGGHAMHNCYQEQLQRVYQQLTGCSLIEAEQFRINVSKKFKEKIDAAQPAWMERAGARLGQEAAEQLWTFMKAWARYGFNKSHAVCYAVIAYACAYLKHHYPLEWWCSVLTHTPKEKIANELWRHCRHVVALPDVQKSHSGWTIEGDSVRAPISLLHGIGEKAHEQLVRYAPYASIEDFARKIKVHQEVTRGPKQRKVKGTEDQYETVVAPGRNALHRGLVHNLIVSGAMDSLFSPAAILRESDFEPVAYPLPRLAPHVPFPTKLSTIECMRMYDAAMGRVFGKAYTKTKKVQYPALDALGRYQARKAVLPIYGDDLRPLVKAMGMPHYLKLYDGRRMRYAYMKWDRRLREEIETEDPVLGGAKLDTLVAAEDAPLGGWSCAVIAYVQATKIFQYPKATKDKTACKLTLEVEGGRYELVHWPDKDGKLPAHVTEIGAGDIVVALLVRWDQGKEFAIRELRLLRAAPGSMKPAAEEKLVDESAENEGKATDDASSDDAGEAAEEG